jgi:fructose/tagatose bisphosphate aldolase
MTNKYLSEAKINISLILIKQNGMNDCCLKLDEDYSSYSHDENRTSSNTNKALCWEYVTFCMAYELMS